MIEIFLWLVSGLPATTYGHGGFNCGDVGKPVQCKYGAITASGVVLHPDEPQVAIAIPKKWRIRPRFIYIRTKDSPCVEVHLVDKMNERYVGKRGFDITPGTLRKLGIKPTKHWSDKIYVCNKEKQI